MRMREEEPGYQYREDYLGNLFSFVRKQEIRVAKCKQDHSVISTMVPPAILPIWKVSAPRSVQEVPWVKDRWSSKEVLLAKDRWRTQGVPRVKDRLSQQRTRACLRWNLLHWCFLCIFVLQSRFFSSSIQPCCFCLAIFGSDLPQLSKESLSMLIPYLAGVSG